MYVHSTVGRHFGILRKKPIMAMIIHYHVMALRNIRHDFINLVSRTLPDQTITLNSLQLLQKIKKIS